MKTYRFEQTVYYSNNYETKISLPDNIWFCEYMRYSDTQRFYFSIVKDPSEELIALFNNTYRRVIKFGNLCIGLLNNVKPLCDIPEITIDEVNNMFESDLRNMYVVTEFQNQKYSWIRQDILRLSVVNTDENNNFEFDEKSIEELTEKLKGIEATYIESIARPIKFVYNNGTNGPGLECDMVSFKSWLDSDKKLNMFQKDAIDITNWNIDDYYSVKGKTSIYVGANADKYKTMFINRINEITKTAYE